VLSVNLTKFVKRLLLATLLSTIVSPTSAFAQTKAPDLEAAALTMRPDKVAS